MATHVFGADDGVTINGVNLSSFVKSARLTYNAESLDETAFGDGTRTHRAGLYDWSVEVTFLHDYDTGMTDATLFSLVGASAFYIKLQPNTATVAGSNPVFSGAVILQDYGPYGGAIGELHVVTARFVAAGTLGRATA